MRVLFVHQNFPGQYKHIAPALAADPENQVVAIGEAGNLGRLGDPRVREIGYPKPDGAGERTHHYIRSLETGVRRGQQVVRTAVSLRNEGFTPDIVCCHPGWGEGLYLRDVWPDARLLYFFEFFYQVDGADSGFDPEFPQRFDDRFRTRTRNALHLLSLEAADWGVTPTRWQQSTLPAAYRPRVSVIFDGIDTDRVCPDAEARFTLPDGRSLGAGDEVITFVNRNLEPYRGYHIFMRALPELLARRPAAQVLIVGGDEVSYGSRPPEGETWRDRFLDEVSDRLDRDRVHFLGRIPYDSFVRLLQVSSLHVYLTYPFVLSWSMIEAMAAGCLVLGSATPPVTEVLSDGVNGLTFDFFDPAALAARADAALSHPDRHAGLRAAARRTVVEGYDLNRVCLPRHLALIRLVAAGDLGGG